MDLNTDGLIAENARLRAALARSGALVERADRLASLGVLTAGLAHEIRNPLVAMRTLAQLLPERWEDAEFRREFAHVAVAEVDRVESLVRELLRLAHESARNETIGDDTATRAVTAPSSVTETDGALPSPSITEIAAAVLPLLRVEGRRKGVDLAFDPRHVVPVTADPLRLRQVVMNLVLNAIEATPDGGTVTIVCTRRDDTSGGRAVLTVRDSGSGVAAHDLPHIFEPFFTTRSDGTGLGLAITRDIVTACKGVIRVESPSTGGAAFVVELPAA